MFLAAACAPSRTTLRETESGEPFRAVCFVARLAKGSGHWLHLASRIPSRKAAVAATRDLIRGSLDFDCALIHGNRAPCHPHRLPCTVPTHIKFPSPGFHNHLFVQQPTLNSGDHCCTGTAAT